jgi:hypothetical protein
MADQRGTRRDRLAFIQQCLKPSCGPVEEEGFDSGSHVLFLPQRTQRNTEDTFDASALCFSVSSVVKLVILSPDETWIPSP